MPTFIPVAIPVDIGIYLARKAEALDRKLSEAARSLETDRGDTRIGAKGLRVLAVRTVETERAIAFAMGIATSMPLIWLKDLVGDIDKMTDFSSLFEHLQTGRSPSDLGSSTRRLSPKPGNLSIRASELNLIVTAIVHWNTIYTGRVMNALREAG